MGEVLEVGPGVNAHQGRRPRHRSRHLGVRRLLLLLDRTAGQCSETFDRGGHLAARRRPPQRRAGERGRQRRRLRRGDECDREPGLPGRDRPARRVAQPARLRDHDRPRRRLQRRQGPAGVERRGRRTRPPRPVDGPGREGRGAREIIAVDPIAERRELAGRLGATHLVDPSAEDPVEAVRRSPSGRGADYVLEAATLAAAQTQAVTMSRRGGTVVFTSIETADATVTLPQVAIAAQSRAILSAQNGNVPHAARPAPLHPHDGGRPGHRPSRSSPAATGSTRSTRRSTPRPRSAT